MTMQQSWLLGWPDGQEQTALANVAAAALPSDGALVLLGGGLGGAAAAIADGMVCNPLSTPLIAFDAWHWDAQSEYVARRAGRPWNFAIGQSYLEAFLQETSPYADRILARPIDPAEAVWNDGPIQTLIVDGVVSRRAAENLLAQFIPALTPGRSTLVVRGLLDPLAPWGLVVVGLLAEDLQLVKKSSQDSLATFRIHRRNETDRESIAQELDLAPDRLEFLADRASSLLGVERSATLPARFALLIDVDRPEQAQELFESEVLSDAEPSADALQEMWSRRLELLAQARKSDPSIGDVALGISAPCVRKHWRYRLSFRARADHARRMHVDVNQSCAPYGNLGLHAQVRLQPAWRTFSLEWDSADDNPTPVVRWRVAGDSTPLEIADVAMHAADGRLLRRWNADELSLIVRGDWSTVGRISEDAPGILRLTLVESPLLRSAPVLLGMTTEAERAAVFDYASTIYLGIGEIVDLGSWLGSTVVPFAQGLMRNHSPAVKRRKVHAFDRFIWEDWMDRTAPGRNLRGRFKAGDSFLDDFLERTAPWERWIEPRPADLTQTGWNGGPIEALFVDAMKSWDLADAIARGFFPHVIPAHGYVFHQDFVHHTTPWIHLLMHRLRDCFEPVRYVEDSGTMIFRLVRPIEPGWFSETLTMAGFSDEEIQEAFAESRRLIPEKMHPLLLGSLSTFYAHSDRFDEARAVLNEARRSDGFDDELSSIETLIEERKAWKLVVHRTLGAVENGRRYVASFTARAEGPRIAPVALRRSRSPWENLGLYKLLKLDERDRRYEFEFMATGEDESAVLQFAVGASRLPLEIRELEFRPASAPQDQWTSGSGPWNIFPVDDQRIERSVLQSDALVLSFR